MMKKFWSVIILYSFVFASLLAQQPDAEEAWDLRHVNQDGLFVFYDAPAGTSSTGKPLDIGDFDDNGCGDIAITGQNASPLGRGSAGHIRIVMNLCDIFGQIAMENLQPGQKVISIFGAYPGDMVGTETYVADFNNDGFDDLLFGAQNSDGPQRDRSNTGAAYVLFGRADFSSLDDIDLQAMPVDMLVMYGATAEDRFGLWVEGGDFDGDGFHDLLVGANQADGEGDHRINAGETWIIYGEPDMVAHYGAMIDMQEPPADATQIIGVDYDDLLGSTVWGADLNGDAYDDAILSAALWRASSGLGGLSFGGGDGPGNRRYNSGETWIVFGSPELRGQVVDLATQIDSDGQLQSDDVTVIYGPDPNDLLGEEIAVGDVNGDGRLDLLLGSLIADGPQNDKDEAGEAWIIYTFEPFEGQMIDLANPVDDRTVVIYSDQIGSKAADTLRAADLDLNGVDDIFMGLPDFSPAGLDGRPRTGAGILAIIFSEPGGPSNDDGQILLSTPPNDLHVRYILGADPYDMSAYAMTVYDVDGDGYVDIAPNGMGGDGVRNDQIDAGEVFVISGAEFMSPDHVVNVIPGETLQPTTPTPWPTSTVVPHATISASQGGNRAVGEQYYAETCFACHGVNGEGVTGLGLSLVTSPLVMFSPDEELLDFLRMGRPVGHPENTTGVSMPPSGGRPDWSDEQLLDIIAHLRWLRDQNG